MALAFDISGLSAFIAAEFPQAASEFEILELTEETTLVSLAPSERHLRPGGTISGPAMFMLADCAIYYAILARIGPKALTVTTNASIDFMRKPEAGKTLLARVDVLKLGRSLAVCEARLFNEGAEAKPVARASMTYSIPPER